jgi:hypothetical protein
MVMGSVGGKLLLFQAACPSVGVGRIKNRDLPGLYGTDRHILQPELRVKSTLNASSSIALRSLQHCGRDVCISVLHHAVAHQGCA